MRTKVIFIACAILWAVGVAVFLSSCKTTHIYNVTYVKKDTVYVEKPVKVGGEYYPNYFPLSKLVTTGVLDSILSIQTDLNKLKLHYTPANSRDAITSDGSNTGGSFLIISGNSSVKTIEGSIIIGGGGCDTGKSFINIGTDSIPTIKPNWQGYEIPTVDTLRKKGFKRNNRNCNIIGCLVNHNNELYSETTNDKY